MGWTEVLSIIRRESSGIVSSLFSLSFWDGFGIVVAMAYFILLHYLKISQVRIKKGQSGTTIGNTEGHS